MNIDKKELTAWVKRERAQFEDTLKTFVEIPSVSAEEARKPDIRRCADAAAK